MAARSDSATRSARDRSTSPARRSALTGSRSKPRGKSRPRPNGSRASSRTRSRSRARRRCWKPSSSTSSSDSSSSTATRASPARSRSWRWGTSGRFSSSTRPSSFRPVLLAVAPAQDRHPHTRARYQRATYSTIGVLPVPPSVRFPTETTGTAGAVDRRQPRSKAWLRMATAEAVARRRQAQSEPGRGRQRAALLAADQAQVACLVHSGQLLWPRHRRSGRPVTLPWRG